MKAKIFSGRTKIIWMLLSIAVSIAIWAYADSDQNIRVEMTFSDLPITYTGEETTLASRGLMLLEDSSQTVTLTLQASRGVIARLDPAKITVSADLSGITETGWQTVSYSVDYGSVSPSNVTRRSSTPSLASIHIGELYSRDVEIRCEVQGQVAKGYLAGEIACTPETIEIRGDQADVDQVSYAKVTLTVDNARSTVSQSLSFQLCDEEGQEVESGNIRTSVEQVLVTLPVNLVKELPLEVDFVEAPGCSESNLSYSIQPETITVSGPADVLEDVEAVILESQFDLTSLSGESTYSYVVTVPSGCENLSGITRATMKIRWKDMSVRTFVVTDFEVGDVPEGKSVSVLTAASNVTLRGRSSDLNGLDAEDIVVTADLSNMSSASGSYTVPAVVSVKGDVDVGAVGEYQLQVTIHDTPQGDEEEESESGTLSEEEESEDGTEDESGSVSGNGGGDTVGTGNSGSESEGSGSGSSAGSATGTGSGTQGHGSGSTTAGDDDNAGTETDEETDTGGNAASGTGTGSTGSELSVPVSGDGSSNGEDGTAAAEEAAAGTSGDAAEENADAPGSSAGMPGRDGTPETEPGGGET